MCNSAGRVADMEARGGGVSGQLLTNEVCLEG